MAKATLKIHKRRSSSTGNDHRVNFAVVAVQQDAHGRRTRTVFVTPSHGAIPGTAEADNLRKWAVAEAKREADNYPQFYHPFTS